MAQPLKTWIRPVSCGPSKVQTRSLSFNCYGNVAVCYLHRAVRYSHIVVQKLITAELKPIENKKNSVSSEASDLR